MEWTIPDFYGKAWVNGTDCGGDGSGVFSAWFSYGYWGNHKSGANGNFNFDIALSRDANYSGKTNSRKKLYPLHYTCSWYVKTSNITN